MLVKEDVSEKCHLRSPQKEAGMRQEGGSRGGRVYGSEGLVRAKVRWEMLGCAPGQPVRVEVGGQGPARIVATELQGPVTTVSLRWVGGQWSLLGRRIPQLNRPF